MIKQKEDNHIEFLQGREFVLLRFLSKNQKTWSGPKFGFFLHRMKALLEHTEIYNDLISKTRQNDVSGIQIITNSLNNRRLMRKLTFPASRID